MKKVLFIFGTRPEAIKLCPVIHAFSGTDLEPRVCATAQHRHLLDQVLKVFQVVPHYDLDLMQPGQTLFKSTSRILAGLEPVLESERPDMVVVQGDTTTTLCGALAGFYRRVPVAHVEAGLRTGDLDHPYPEEMNRLVTTRLAALHFAPTSGAARNLVAEGVPSSRVFVTGNTGIDAVLSVRDALCAGRIPAPSDWDQFGASRKLIVVTAHRRESFGAAFERICEALHDLARRDDVEIVFPVHPNPNVQVPVARHLSGLPNVHLIEPLEYVAFVDLMRRAWMLITDSGGIQEEAPSFGKPVLVLREKTERPEAVEAGTVRVTGTDRGSIVTEAQRLLDDPAAYDAMSRVHNPYGDGRASGRILAAIRSFLTK
jgi:UDP-N-acetylglucosamine 2-epimerase (non-hydrolysing)